MLEYPLFSGSLTVFSSLYFPCANLNYREAFEGIYLNLSKQPGTTRFAESGWGWKPSGGGDTFTLDHTQIVQAQWSRAARGYEVKVLSRADGVIQLDGFQQEVRLYTPTRGSY